MSIGACEFSRVSQQPLTVEFPSILHEKQWRGFTKRVIYYISKDAQQVVVEEGLTTRYKQLRVYKGGSLPILSCVIVDKRFSLETYGNAGCPLASGAVYPYNRTDIAAVRLDYGLPARVARFVLLFHRHGGNTRVLNVRRLLRAMGTSPIVVNREMFFQSVARNSLSRYSIKAQKVFKVQVPKKAQVWLRSWISVSDDAFAFMQKSAEIPMGLWMFLNPHGDDYAVISVNNDGAAMFSLY